MSELFTMVTTFNLPLQSGAPPLGFGWDKFSISELSTTTAFDTRIDGRDTFLGQRTCVICGEEVFDHCHIIPQAEINTVSQQS
jgi:hypothetical protein